MSCALNANNFMKDEVILKGTCIDLKSAYKQCPVKPEHEKYSVFELKNPETNKVEYFLA